MSNHHPGPWLTMRADEWDKIHGRYAGEVAVWTPPGRCEIDSESDDWPNLIAYAMTEEANLIAAAPELLAACINAKELIEVLLRVLPHNLLNENLADDFDVALTATGNAIAKAKGESK